MIRSKRLEETEKKVEEFILEQESIFEGFQVKESFLWDHSLRVANLAVWLASQPPVATHLAKMEVFYLAGLLHDAGKFGVDKEEGDKTTEEKLSATIARTVLNDIGWSESVVETLCRSFEELYNDVTTNPVTAILRDADTLSKLGRQGLLTFVSKWTLRGFPPSVMVRKKLSVELTYAKNAADTMLTPQGREAAIEEARWTRLFFDDLLDQWRRQGIVDLTTVESEVAGVPIVHVSKPHSQCGSARWNWTYELSKDVKCTKVSVEGTCPSCGRSESQSFCLPMLLKSR